MKQPAGQMRNFKKFEVGELKNFKNADFFQIFRSVYRQQILMLEKLQMKKTELDKKLRCIHAWKAAALAAAASIPIGSMGKWVDSLLQSYENAIRGQKEVIRAIQVATYVAIKDLDNIRVLIDRLEVEIEFLLANSEFATTGDSAVKVGAGEIRKKLDVFMKNVEDLGMRADAWSRDIHRARIVVLQRIIKNPNH